MASTPVRFPPAPLGGWAATAVAVRMAVNGPENASLLHLAEDLTLFVLCLGAVSLCPSIFDAGPSADRSPSLDPSSASMRWARR